MSAPVSADVVRAYAEAFLSAGGSITLGDWADMDQATRDAFEAAGLAVEARRLARLAAALGNHVAATQILEPHDGGLSASYVEILRQMEVAGGGKQ